MLIFIVPHGFWSKRQDTKLDKTSSPLQGLVNIQFSKVLIWSLLYPPLINMPQDLSPLETKLSACALYKELNSLIAQGGMSYLGHPK